MHSGGIFSKVFWILVLICVFCVVLVQLKHLLQYFLENPTLTSISVIYPEDGLQFPSLVICILTKINRTKGRPWTNTLITMVVMKMMEMMVVVVVS